MSQTPKKSKAVLKQAVHDTDQAAIAALETHRDALSTAIQQTTNAPPPVTADQQHKLHELIMARQEVNRTITEYYLLDSLDLNSSSAVKAQIAALNKANFRLKQSIDQVNAVVGVITNVASVMATLDKALTAARALIGLV